MKARAARPGEVPSPGAESSTAAWIAAGVALVMTIASLFAAALIR
jgi:hypothetical protein